MTRVFFSGPATTRMIALFELDLRDLLLARTSGQERGLVDQIGEVGAGKAGV